MRRCAMLWQLLVLAAVVMSTGCRLDLFAGGGIGGSGFTGSTTVSSTGVVTASPRGITVNGTDFDTTGAVVVVDGVEVSDAGALKAGMVVQVQGRVSAGGATGTAERIEYRDMVQGKVDHIDLELGTIEVLGQVVVVDELTAFDPAGLGLGDLSVGDPVEVSGLVDEVGNIVATYIAVDLPASGGDALEVTGFVSQATDRRFRINGLVVDYATARLEGFGDRFPADGDFVEALGRQLDPESGALVAQTVTNRTQSYPDGVQVVSEGLVEEVSDTAVAMVTPAGLQVFVIDEETEFSGGGAEALQPGQRLTIEATVVAEELVSRKIKINLQEAVDEIE